MEIVFVRDGLTGVSKQPTIAKKDVQTITPLLYFQRAKGAKKVEFEAVVNFVIQLMEKTMKNQQ